jgi:hypothetical protein
VVLSSSKNRYHLGGEIDKAMCKEHGFNREIIRLFKDGFPEDWKECLLLHRAASPTVERKEPSPTKVESTPVEEKKSAKKGNARGMRS